MRSWATTELQCSQKNMYSHNSFIIYSNLYITTCFAKHICLPIRFIRQRWVLYLETHTLGYSLSYTTAIRSMYILGKSMCVFVCACVCVFVSVCGHVCVKICFESILFIINIIYMMMMMMMMMINIMNIIQIQMVFFNILWRGCQADVFDL